MTFALAPETRADRVTRWRSLTEAAQRRAASPLLARGRTLKRDIEAPSKQLLTEREARLWLESQGVEASERLWKDWVRKGYVFGVRKYNRQNVLYHWQGLVALLWRVELDDADANELERNSTETEPN